MKLKSLFIVALSFILVFISTIAFTQETEISQKEQRKLDKEKKKQEKETAALESQKVYAEMLESKYYVFMGNSLAGDAGAVYSVTPAYNFLSVSGNQVVFQFSFDGIVGWNGIGGITLKGEIEDYKFEPAKNSKKPMRVTASVRTTTRWGKPYLTMTVFEEGYASITLTVKESTINMSGQVVKPEDSGVYEGMEILLDR